MSTPFTINQIKHSLYFSTIFPNFKKYMTPRVQYDFDTILNLTRVAVFGEGFAHDSLDHKTIYFKLESGVGYYFWDRSEEEEILSIILSNKKSTYAEFIIAISGYYFTIKNNPQTNYKSSEDIKTA